MRILLVEPDFPIPPKSKNHGCFLPVGLLKLATYHREMGDEIRLVRGNELPRRFAPDEIKVTSLFTYWSKHVWYTVRFYRNKFPHAKIVVGGIYASLMPEHCKKSACDEVFVGVHGEAEKEKPAYDLVDVDYQIVHTTRGCPRRCKFCGTWKIEPKFTYKKSILDEICSNRIVFYDNNLLANPYVERILDELSRTKHEGRVIHCECQCGIDGRLLTPKLARMVKAARFVNPRIAWDHRYSKHAEIRRQLDLLIGAGYRAKDIYVFMLYNYGVSYCEMLKKLKKCREWGVQIADCRYRPLDQRFDEYNPVKKQSSEDYYIHPNWTDRQVKLFRRKVRQQNIVIRHGFQRYDKKLEKLAARKRRNKNTN